MDVEGQGAKTTSDNVRGSSPLNMSLFALMSSGQGVPMKAAHTGQSYHSTSNTFSQLHPFLSLCHSLPLSAYHPHTHSPTKKKLNIYCLGMFLLFRVDLECDVLYLFFHEYMLKHYYFFFFFKTHISKSFLLTLLCVVNYKQAISKHKKWHIHGNTRRC